MPFDLPTSPPDPTESKSEHKFGAELGHRLPPELPHAISVSFPTWEDNLGYVSADPRVHTRMKSGYPRFKVHYLIEELGDRLRMRLTSPKKFEDEKCYLFPSRRFATMCSEYLSRFSPRPLEECEVRVESYELPLPRDPTSNAATGGNIDLFLAFFPLDLAKIAKSFWQHTGLGISSRMAEYCLSVMALEGSEPSLDLQSRNDVRAFHALPLDEAQKAKLAIRNRIARLVDDPDAPELTPGKDARAREDVVNGEKDVMLFPSGMSAILHTHLSILECFPGSKSVCFGFPYTDTLKILEKFGPGATLFANSSASDLPALLSLLQSSKDAGTPIAALWCEYPSNPLLRTPPLAELRKLADEWGFVICLDDTIGSWANVDVMPFVDVLCTSLSKVFSGRADVMGGSVIFNPSSPHSQRLQASLSASFEDHYWPEDVLAMEHNSRDYVSRIRTMNTNAEAIVDFLRSRALCAASTDDERKGRVIKDVCYPKYVTRELYEVCRRGSDQQRARARTASTTTTAEGGFSMLFSITFVSPLASSTFYDNLHIAKGPSLGTNFTLACPYTILGHPFELEWAESLGVERGIVRVSAGLESKEVLLGIFEEALRITEEVVARAGPGQE